MTLTYQNPSLQVTKDHRIELKGAPVKPPLKGQVLIHVWFGHTFLEIWIYGDLKVLDNCILGHEAAGDVVEIGESVTNVSVGDRVAIEPCVPCGNCFLCSQGDYNLCGDVQFIGVSLSWVDAKIYYS